MIALTLLAVLVLVALMIRAGSQRSTERTAVPAPAEPSASLPLVAEALGYVGAVLTVVGLLLVVSRFWPDMSTAGRLALTGSGAAVLTAAGAAVPGSASGTLARLRAVTWTAATAVAGLFAGIVAGDALEATDLVTACTVAATVAVVAGGFWAWRSHLLHQLVALGAAVVVVATGVDLVASHAVGGLATWAAGAALVVAGLTRRTERPAVTEVVGSLAAIFGAALTASDWTGAALLLMPATAAAMLALALVPGVAPDRVDETVLTVFGVVAAVQGVPGAIGYFAEQAAGVTGIVVWIIGGALLAIGMRRLVRVPTAVEAVGGLTMIGGAALTGVQWSWLAPLFGIATALGLLALGALPGHLDLSILGSLGLVVNVPWAVGRFFPGEGRVPLLIMVAGVLIVASAVLLARSGDRFHHGAGPGPVSPAH